MKTFADKLRAWQGDRTDAQAAEALGVNLRTYHDWKAGRYVPRPFVRGVIEDKIAK